MSALPSVKLLMESLSIAGAAYPEVAAVQLLEDLTRLGLTEFRLGRKIPTELGPVIEYTFGNTGYSIEKADPERAPNFMPSDHGGTQLNSENVLFLIRVSEIARELVPEVWLQPSDNLVGKFRTGHQHLDTLNEFWWLSRWTSRFKAQSDYRMHVDSSMDIDWRLTWDFGLSSISVNLEAKRRRDVLRSLGDPIDPKQIFEDGLFDKVGRCKFTPSKPDEINVLAITLIGEIDRDVQYHAVNWLKTRQDIDAIALFSRYSLRKTAFDLHVQRKQDLLSQVLNCDLHEKDNRLHSIIEYPLPYKISQLGFLP